MTWNVGDRVVGYSESHEDDKDFNGLEGIIKYTHGKDSNLHYTIYYPQIDDEWYYDWYELKPAKNVGILNIINNL